MSINKLKPEQIRTFAAAGRQIADAGLVRFNSGNLSWRVANNRIAVTAKGAWLGDLDAESIALCRLTDQTALNDITPSVESGFHAGVMLKRPEINVVLHCQSPCATAVACGGPARHDFAVIPEVPFYIGEPAIVEYFSPGSKELAGAVIAAMCNHNFVVLRNHGQVTVGRDLDEAILRAGFFELACEIICHGPNTHPMPQSGIEALRARAAVEMDQV